MIKKDSIRSVLAVVVGCFGLGCLMLGCKTSSHTTVRTFEYTNEPVKTQEPVDTASGEYQMESPGQMVVDPSRN